MYEIAQSMIDEAGDGFKDAELDVFRQRAQQAIFADIDATLQRIGIRFDSYYNEHDLYEKGLVEDVVAALRAKGLVYEQDGAAWFKTTAFGQAQYRVIIKNTREPTYRLPDIAYHREKFRRGFERMVRYLDGLCRRAYMIALLFATKQRQFLTPHLSFSSLPASFFL